MKNRILIGFFICISCLYGCKSTNTAANFQESVPLKSIQLSKSVAEETLTYVLQPDDVIEIKFFYVPELNEIVTIGKDSKISLQLIDEIQAAGLTVMELDQLLTERYSNVLKNVDLTVLVREVSEKYIFVGGEVGNPGIIQLPYSKLNVAQAIFAAGGPKRTAALDSVVLLRDRKNEKPEFFVINFDPFNNSGRQTAHHKLEPYDIVFVPKTQIAKLNDFVDQYFVKLVPVSLTAGFEWLYMVN